MKTRTAWMLVVAMVASLATLVPAAPASAQKVSHSQLVSEDPVDNTPHVVDGRVNAIAQIGDRVIVGGDFTQVRNQGSVTILTRRNMFAFSASTGQILTGFNPRPDDVVEAIQPAPDGESVYIGGNFNVVDGQTRRKVAKVAVPSGAVDLGFKANFDARVLDLLVVNDELFVAGAFHSIGGTTNGVLRESLAAVDLDTGAADPGVNVKFTGPFLGNGIQTVRKIDADPAGTKLVAIGNFTKAGTKTRSQVAVLNIGGAQATVANWRAPAFDLECSGAFDAYVRDVDVSPDGEYFVIGTTGAWRPLRLCDSNSRWELDASGANVEATWIDWSGGDTTYSVSVTGTAVYTGGHTRWWNNPYDSNAQGPGGVPRTGIAALDPLNGLPLDWDPTRDRGVGVFAFVPTDDGLWVGSDTDTIGNEFHSRIAFMPLLGGASVAPTRVARLPNDLYMLKRNASGPMIRRPYNGTTFGSKTTVATGINWNDARGAFVVNNVLYTGWNDGRLLARSFNGTSLGLEEPVEMYGLDTRPVPSAFRIPGTNLDVPRFAQHLTNMTGMFYDGGRLYYTVSGDPRLYYRYFTPSTRIVGAILHVSDTTAASGIDWATIRGMTLAGGSVYYVRSDGTLVKTPFSEGAISGPQTPVSGPAIDGENWSARGLFVLDQVLDTFPPTVPGTPTASSTRVGEVDVTWQSSTDGKSDTLTYRIYRDGALTPLDEVTTDEQGQLSFTDVGLSGGEMHSYQISSVDEGSNESAKSAASNVATVLGADTTDPAKPGTPTGTGVGKTKIQISWAASTDDRDTELTYRVFRDGETTAIAEFDSTSTTTVGYLDEGLDPGSSHTYVVEAEDDAGNISEQSDPSDEIATQGVAFEDDFSTGDFSKWDFESHMSIDITDGAAAIPSARANTTNQPGYARVNLPAPVPSSCLSAAVKVTDRGTTGLDLLRMRTATGGIITKTYVSNANEIILRSDFAATQKLSGVQLPTGWHTYEMCGTVGTTSLWDLYLDGTQIVTAWQADTGTTDIGRVQIGDTGNKTAIANYDDVVVDGEPG